MFQVCQLDRWLTQSKSLFTVSSAKIFGAGACNGLHPGDFWVYAADVLMHNEKLLYFA